MKKPPLFFIALFCITHCFSQDIAKLEELMTAYSNQYKFNGAVFVSYKGKILLDKGYGLRNASDKTINDNTSIFQIGSITKQFTSTMILKLQEEKKLNVADKLSKYFPDYPKGDSITIEHLLTHTSGIYSYTSDQAFMENEVSKPANRQKMMALFKDKPLQFSPGTKWDYSNSAYSLLGYIIEDVAKMPYELPKEKTTIFLPEEVLKQYIGIYELSPELMVTISVEDGKLIGKPEGQEALQLHPEKEDQFFLKEIEAQVKFTRNEKKEVIEMKLLQNGRELSGKKR